MACWRNNVSLVYCIPLAREILVLRYNIVLTVIDLKPIQYTIFSNLLQYYDDLIDMFLRKNCSVVRKNFYYTSKALYKHEIKIHMYTYRSSRLVRGKEIFISKNIL